MHATVLIALALLLAAISFSHLRSSPLSIPSTWLAFNFFLLGLAHIFKLHQIFGKRSNGTLPSWSWLLFLPLHLTSLTILRLSQTFGREPLITHVTDTLSIGSRPTNSDLLKQFSNIIDLTAEFSEPKSIRQLPGYLAFPILDANAPAAQDLLKTLQRLHPGKTFIHCAQGHGRTAMVAAALLLFHQKSSNPEDALAILKNARPAIRLNSNQANCLHNLRLLLENKS